MDDSDREFPNLMHGADRAVGPLSGKKVPYDMVKKARQLEVRRMKQFIGYQWKQCGFIIKGAKMVGSRWVEDFKIGEDGTVIVRSRIVAKEFAFKKI